MLYSQDALANVVGMERRALRRFIEEKGIQPTTDVRAKDGRRMGKYRPADIYRAQNSRRYEDGKQICLMLGQHLFHPESPLMKQIAAGLPNEELIPNLVAIIETGWDSVEDFLGEHSEGRD